MPRPGFLILSHLNGSDLKFPELGLREAKPHFDAQPGQRPIFTQHEDASAVAEALTRLCVTSTCAVEIRRVKTQSLEVLNKVTSDFLTSLNNNEPSQTLG